MRVALQTLFYSLATIVLVITAIVGILTVIEKVKDMIVGTYRQFISLRLSKIRKHVLGFMKRTHPTQYYQVDEISAGVKITNRQTWDALEALERKNSVHRLKMDEAIGGAVWVLDELDR